MQKVSILGDMLFLTFYWKSFSWMRMASNLMIPVKARLQVRINLSFFKNQQKNKQEQHFNQICRQVSLEIHRFYQNSRQTHQKTHKFAQQNFANLLNCFIIKQRMIRDTRKINIETNFYDDDEYNITKPHEQTFETNLLNRDRGVIALYNILDTFRLHRIVNAFNIIHSQPQPRISKYSDRNLFTGSRSQHRAVGSSQPNHKYNIHEQRIETEYQQPQFNSILYNKKRSQSLSNQTRNHSHFLRESRKKILLSINKTFQQSIDDKNIKTQPKKPTSTSKPKIKEQKIVVVNRINEQNQQRQNLQIKNRIQRLQKLMKNIRRQKQKNQPVIIHQKRQVAQIPKQQKNHDQMRVFMEEIQTLRHEMHQIKIINQQILHHSRQRSIRSSRTPSRSDSQAFPEVLQSPTYPNGNIKRSQFIQSSKLAQKPPTNNSQKGYHPSSHHRRQKIDQRIKPRQQIKSQNKQYRRKQDRAPQKQYRNQKIRLKYQGHPMQRYQPRDNQPNTRQKYSRPVRTTNNTNKSDIINYQQYNQQNRQYPNLQKYNKKYEYEYESKQKLPPKSKTLQNQQQQYQHQFPNKMSNRNQYTKADRDRNQDRNMEWGRQEQVVDRHTRNQYEGYSSYRNNANDRNVQNWLNSLTNQQKIKPISPTPIIPKPISNNNSSTSTGKIQYPYKTSDWYRQYGSPTYNISTTLANPLQPKPTTTSSTKPTIQPTPYQYPKPRHNLQLLNLQQIKDTVSNSNANSSRTSNMNSINSRSNSPQNHNIGMGMGTGTHTRYQEYNIGGNKYGEYSSYGSLGGFHVKEASFGNNTGGGSSDYTNPNLLRQLNIGPFPKTQSQRSSAEHSYKYQPPAKPTQANPPTSYRPNPTSDYRLASLRTISDNANQISSYTYSKDSSPGTSMAKLEQQYQNIINDSPFVNKNEHHYHQHSGQYPNYHHDNNNSVDDSINMKKIANLEDQVNRYFAKTNSIEGEADYGVSNWSGSQRYQEMYEKYANGG